VKIMHVVPYIKNESAGTTHVVIALCRALVNKGCEVVLYTLEPIPKKDYGFKIKSFKPSKFPHPSLGRSKPMYQALLHDAKEYDVIHNHILWMAPNYYSGLVANKLDIPYITAPHGTLSEWALNRSKWKKKISMFLGQKKALDTVSCFHVTAESEKKELNNLGYTTPCAIIPNGIDAPVMTKRMSNSHLKSLVFMSRIHPKKGLDLLINSWVKIQDKFDDWELLIIGPDDHAEYSVEMKELVKDLGLKRLKFVGEVIGDDKYQYLTDASIFVFPTYSENFGMVVAEALACGTPVISTKGAPWQGLEEHNAGWWIDIGVEPLVEALSQSMSLDDATLEQMGDNGRKWMNDEYSWSNIAKDMIKTYEWLIDKDEKPECVKL
jgi:glycosyltransferase involved in cell wall biosynthesis